MKSFKFLSASAVALTLASCANNKNQYDTSSPYGPADAAADSYQAPAPTNQTYDTPAAYEDAATASSSAPSVNLPADATPGRKTTKPATSPAVVDRTPAASGPGTVHVVVKGDTLSGISHKYKVPVASIKAANNMTKDTVVLGAKLKIPAH